MTDTELKELIEDCCNEIANKIEPLANVKARLYTSLKPAINYTRCSLQLKDKNSTTIKEYAIELLDIEDNPNNSNKEWKKVVIENTITKLQEVIQTL